MTEWHQSWLRGLLGQLLAFQTQGRSLEAQLCQTLGLSVANIQAARALVRAVHDATSAHFFRAEGLDAKAIVINTQRLKDFQAGGEFEEYAAFSEDPCIGNIWVQNTDEYALAVLAHELSHFLVHQVWRKAPGAEKPKPHGTEFQSIYRLVRDRGLNPYLADAQALAKQTAQTKTSVRVVRKLNALRAMAEHQHSNAHEAERAQAQLTALLDKHQLGFDDLDQDPAPALVERWVPMLGTHTKKVFTAMARQLEALFGIETFFQARRAVTPTGQYKRSFERQMALFGAPDDVDRALYLCELVHRALHAELAAYKATDAYGQLSQQRLGRAACSNFTDAFADRLASRLRTAIGNKDEHLSEQSPATQALMASRVDHVATLFQARHPNLKPARPSARRRRRIGSAQSVGRRAAERINLNNPLTRTGTRKALGAPD